jgi:hypothetical protein
MYIFDYSGEPLCEQKIVPGNTVTGLSASCYEYLEYTLQVNGVDAGTTEPAAGGWVVGAAGARAIIVSATLDSGAWGNVNARVTLRLKSLSGTFVATENVAYGANADHFTVRTAFSQVLCSDEYRYKGMLAKAILVSVDAQTALCSWSGATPDQTSLIGQSIVAGASIMIQDANAIRKFKCVDRVGSSASNVQITFYF